MNRIKGIYKELFQKHGRPKGQWNLWCKRPKTVQEKEEVIVGAVLTQHTNWNNVEKAIANLKDEGVCSLKRIYHLGEKDKERLSLLIKPSGFYRQKTQYLFNLSQFVIENYQGIEGMEKEETAILRKRLLSLKGLGPETVDSILLYGLEKPVFIIDEYTRRLAKKYKLAQDLSYGSLQKLFQGSITRDYCLYQDFHALIIIEEKARSH